MKLTKECLAALRAVANGNRGTAPSMGFGRHLSALAHACLIRHNGTSGYVLTTDGENCLKEHE